MLKKNKKMNDSIDWFQSYNRQIVIDLIFDDSNYAVASQPFELVIK